MVPIAVTHLFSKLDELLINCLRSCTIDDWKRPTLAKKWTIKDIAAHLLDGNLRSLSMGRDQYFGETPPALESYADLVAWLNELNADWVKACQRISPSLLISLLDCTGPAVTRHYQQLDLAAPAVFGVAWAGEEQSANWFHLAREYTEKWHHQAQIRDALNQTAPLLSREFYHPFLQTMMRGLPHQYRHTDAAYGTTLQLIVGGAAGGQWFLQKTSDGWKLAENGISHTTLRLEPEIAWKLFTKGIRPEQMPLTSTKMINIEGDPDLARPALNMIAVMA